jgi:TolB-like protein
MPQDIFISYSSKDKEKADQLSELLASAGLSVWIDRQGIIGAEKWATEIVEGIQGCSTFIILLSQHSIASENVLRELSLASEKRKRVLPVMIEEIVLPSSFEYPLAGLQRVAISEFDKILYAHKHGVEKLIKKDERKSLMILPFEDLSPTADNGWFADGIVSELISALSNIRSIRMADLHATKVFRKYQGQLTTYAREMNYRYFVQGDVRKFGDNIKISARLLDIETGDHLWQESMKGTMENIFDFQEEVALKVVEGLKVHLGSEEKRKLVERGTENAEAYELYMKAAEYFARQNRKGFELGIELITEAIRLDPTYARAYQSKANALGVLYRLYDKTPAILDEAEWLCKEALRLEPDLYSVYQPLSRIYMYRGQLAEAEEAAKEYIRKVPQSAYGHFTLAMFYYDTGQSHKEIASFEDAVRLDPDNLPIVFNLVAACDLADEQEKCRHWALVALPLIERYLKLNPDDKGKHVEYGLLLHWSGKNDKAYAEAMKLTDLKDGLTLYHAACLFGRINHPQEALRTFRKAIEAGYKNIRLMKEFLTDEKEGVVTLAGTPEYEEVKQIVEKMSEP